MARAVSVPAVCQMFFDMQEENARQCNIHDNHTQPEKSLAYTAICSAELRAGRRQSIPSSNMEGCAGVSETTPRLACDRSH